MKKEINSFPRSSLESEVKQNDRKPIQIYRFGYILIQNVFQYMNEVNQISHRNLSFDVYACLLDLNLLDIIFNTRISNFTRKLPKSKEIAAVIRDVM